MSSLKHLLILITSAVGIATAQDQRWTRTPDCIRADTKDISVLQKCYDTVSLSVELVDSANGDFDRALEAADTDEGDDDSDIDNYFLRYLLKGKFNGQRVFYKDTAKTLSDLSLAVVALGIAEDDSTNPALRIICPELNLNVYRLFQLQSQSLDDVACGGLYIPSPSSSAACSATSTTSTLSSAPSSSSSSLTLPNPSSSATSSSSNSFTTPHPLAVTTLRSSSTTTSCTTGASASVSAVSKRQVNDDADLDEYTTWVLSALFALDQIEKGNDNIECQAGDFWVKRYNKSGLKGEYVEDLMQEYN
ncbi:hypothetical protein Q7P36_005541 [Cladosporium allicinum]